MTPQLILRCGCSVPFDAAKTSAPICEMHGHQAVVRVLGLQKPRIRGVARGPLVECVDLPPFIGALGPEKET
jgi:predicted ABC-type sugar transport system permease subunit